MAKRTKKTEGKQKGAQEHGEGQHGQKTRARHQEILRAGPSAEARVTDVRPERDDDEEPPPAA